MRLDLQAVCKRYEGRTILDDANLSLERGECVRLVGPSGLGKSTLLEVAAGLSPPDTGRVSRCGDVAMTFQDDALLPWMDAQGNLDYALSAKPHLKKEIPLWLTRFELPARLRPAEMSGGMRRRLSLARALATQADILFLDEPFAFLDAAWRERVVEMIDSAAQAGTSVLFSTHQFEEMPRSCSRSVTLAQGRVMTC